MVKIVFNPRVYNWVRGKKHLLGRNTRQISGRKMELEEKVAKSKTKIKVFQELVQPTTALRTSFASKKNAPCGKTIQADSYCNVTPLDALYQRCTDRREHGSILQGLLR